MALDILHKLILLEYRFKQSFDPRLIRPYLTGYLRLNTRQKIKTNTRRSKAKYNKQSRLSA